MNQRDPIRVLYLDHVARLSGAEQSLLDLVVGLSHGPVEPIVVLPGDGPLATKLREQGILVRMVPMSKRMLETSRTSLVRKPFLVLARLWAFLAASMRIYKIVREMQPHVIHTNTLKTHLLAVIPAKLARVPLVWHVRDILPKGWLRRAFVLFARVPKLIVVPSRSVAAGFGRKRKTIYKKLRLIPNGVRVDELANATAAGKGLRAEVGANGSPLVGIVGRIAPWKGQEVFIRAAAMLADRYPKARFAVIGAVLFPENDIPFQQKLQDLVAEAGLSDRIYFLGWRSTVEAMGALDVLVHASTEPEPFGRTIIEAMAAGVPVVASASGAIRELVPPNAGIVIPPGRPDILADALDTLIGDKYMRQEMGNAGRSIAFGYFDVRRTIAGVGAMYTEIARRRRFRPEQEPRRSKIKPIVFPRRPVEHVAPPLASNGGGNGHTTPPETPRRARRSEVRRLVARVEAPRRSADSDGEPLRRSVQPPQRWDTDIAARATETPVKERRPAARAIPAVKPKAPPRRTLPDTSPEVPELPAHFRREAPVTAAQAARSVPMRVVAAPQELEAPPRRAPLAPATDQPVQAEPKPAYEIVKRLIDIAVSLAVLVIGGPVWLLVAVAIKLDSPGPALFRNTVIGRNAVPFTYFKFRSMRIDSGDDEHRAFIEKYVRENGGTESDGQMIFKFVGDRRVTRIGRFIRKLSFDEVPQLINVLRGEMSIVGPRPPLRYEYELYDGYAKQRLAVMPGLTGLQQVEARHTASFSDKIEMDLDYIRRRSLALDIMIMLKSIPAAFKGE